MKGMLESFKDCSGYLVLEEELTEFNIFMLDTNKISWSEVSKILKNPIVYKSYNLTREELSQDENTRYDLVLEHNKKVVLYNNSVTKV